MYNLKRMYKHKYRTLPVLHCEDIKDAFFTVKMNFPACMSDYILELYEILTENSLLSNAIQ